MEKEQIDVLLEFAERTGFQFNNSRHKSDIKRNAQKWSPDFKVHCLQEFTKLHSLSIDDRLAKEELLADNAIKIKNLKIKNYELKNLVSNIDDLKEDRRYLREENRFLRKQINELMMRIPKQSQTNVPLATSIFSEANDAI